jgi:hypothetical protein
MSITQSRPANIESNKNRASPTYLDNLEAGKTGALETTALEATSNVSTEKNDATTKALIWKQDLRIVPLCAAIYLLCYLDRSNIGASN